MTTASRWNLNLHYHSLILDAVPPTAATALDVGSGDGLLTFDLAERAITTIGIDPDAASVERSSADARNSERTSFVCADLFDYPFDLASFDLIASVAMLHHVDARRGLERMNELVRPGGTIALIGFARPATWRDHALSVTGALLTRYRKARGSYWEHNAPISWPPPLTTTEMVELANEILPGARFRPLMSNRYVLLWQKPV